MSKARAPLFTELPVRCFLGNSLPYSDVTQARTFGSGLDRNTFDDEHR